MEATLETLSPVVFPQKNLKTRWDATFGTERYRVEDYFFEYLNEFPKPDPAKLKKLEGTIASDPFPFYVDYVLQHSGFVTDQEKLEACWYLLKDNHSAKALGFITEKPRKLNYKTSNDLLNYVQRHVTAKQLALFVNCYEDGLKHTYRIQLNSLRKSGKTFSEKERQYITEFFNYLEPAHYSKYIIHVHAPDEATTNIVDVQWLVSLYINCGMLGLFSTEVVEFYSNLLYGTDLSEPYSVHMESLLKEQKLTFTPVTVPPSLLNEEGYADVAEVIGSLKRSFSEEEQSCYESGLHFLTHNPISDSERKNRDDELYYRYKWFHKAWCVNPHVTSVLIFEYFKMNYGIYKQNVDDDGISDILFGVMSAELIFAFTQINVASEINATLLHGFERNKNLHNQKVLMDILQQAEQAPTKSYPYRTGMQNTICRIIASNQDLVWTLDNIDVLEKLGYFSLMSDKNKIAWGRSRFEFDETTPDSWVLKTVDNPGM